MEPKLIHISAIAVLLSCAGISTAARADITAANAHADRGPFEACGNAVDNLDDSVPGTRAKATQACGASMIYYARKLDAAKSEDDTCINGLYAGSSAARYGAILKTSMNQSGSIKALAIAKKMLRAVIANCPDEPNILLGAKGVLGTLKTQ